MNKQQQEFYEVFTDLQCLILAHMNKGDSSGVTATHYNIIEYIYRHKEATGKQIANAYHISQAAISKQLKFLIANKLITQQQSATDRRVFYLGITTQGKFIVDNSENFRQSIARKTARKLTRDQLKQLTGLLQQMLEGIKE